jgi:uncharacterized protein
MAKSLLASGRYVDLMNLTVDQISLLDLVGPVSRICRYGGHVNRFYSVAQHSVLLSYAVPLHLAKAAVLHDLVEGYVMDCPRPYKHLAPALVEIEDTIGAMIFEAMGVDYGLMKELRDYDVSICIDEMKVLCTEVDPGLEKAGFKALGVPVVPIYPEMAESMLWARLVDLFGTEKINALRI